MQPLPWCGTVRSILSNREETSPLRKVIFLLLYSLHFGRLCLTMAWICAGHQWYASIFDLSLRKTGKWNDSFRSLQKNSIAASLLEIVVGKGFLDRIFDSQRASSHYLSKRFHSPPEPLPNPHHHSIRRLLTSGIRSSNVPCRALRLRRRPQLRLPAILGLRRQYGRSTDTQTGTRRRND